MEVAVIGVAGAGTMGHGITQVAAQAGYYVVLYDYDPRMLARAKERILESLRKFAEKEPLREREYLESFGRICYTSDLGEFDDVDFVVEAVPEDEMIKGALYQMLDKVVRPQCIIASNTSSLSISRLAAATCRPKRFVGMHFMNPPQLVPLLELVRGRETSCTTLSVARHVAERMGRAPIIECKDRPGFVVNRILMTAINEAAKLVEEGVAGREEVNKSAVLSVGTGKAMPVLQLADLIGLDVCRNVLGVLEEELGVEYKPAEILEWMVREGSLGRKTGKGFFDYQNGHLL